MRCRLPSPAGNSRLRQETGTFVRTVSATPIPALAPMARAPGPRAAGSSSSITQTAILWPPTQRCTATSAAAPSATILSAGRIADVGASAVLPVRNYRPRRSLPSARARPFQGLFRRAPFQILCPTDRGQFLADLLMQAATAQCCRLIGVSGQAQQGSQLT